MPSFCLLSLPSVPQVAATLSITATNAATRENSTLPLLGASRKMEEGQLGKDSRGRQQVAHYFVMGFFIFHCSPEQKQEVFFPPHTG